MLRSWSLCRSSCVAACCWRFRRPQCQQRRRQFLKLARSLTLPTRQWVLQSAFRTGRCPRSGTPRLLVSSRPDHQSSSGRRYCPCPFPQIAHSEFAPGSHYFQEVETVRSPQMTAHSLYSSLSFDCVFALTLYCVHGTQASFPRRTGATLACYWPWSDDRWAFDGLCPEYRCSSFSSWPSNCSHYYRQRSWWWPRPQGRRLNLIGWAAWLALYKYWFWNCRRSRLLLPIPFAIASFCHRYWRPE